MPGLTLEYNKIKSLFAMTYPQFLEPGNVIAAYSAFDGKNVIGKIISIKKCEVIDLFDVDSFEIILEDENGKRLRFLTAESALVSYLSTNPQPIESQIVWVDKKA